MADLLPMSFVLLCGLCLVLVLLSLWQSLRGLFASQGDRVSADRAGGAARAVLEHEKGELLIALRELRFEHELGKLSQADFAKLEQRYRSRARDVLRQLDQEIEPHRAEARALIAQALGSSATATTPTNANTTETPKAATEEPSGRACPSCTTRNDADAVFCKKCGARVQPETAS